MLQWKEGGEGTGRKRGASERVSVENSIGIGFPLLPFLPFPSLSSLLSSLPGSKGKREDCELGSIIMLEYSLVRVRVLMYVTKYAASFVSDLACNLHSLEQTMQY